MAIGFAVVSAAIISVSATNIWTAPGGTIEMTMSAVAAGVALGLVGAATSQVSLCSSPPCRAQADALSRSLIAISVALTIFTASAVVLAIGAGIVWVGIAIGAAMATAAAAIGISLIAVSLSQLPALSSCRSAASTLTTVQTIVGTIVGVLVLGAALVLGVGLAPPAG